MIAPLHALYSVLMKTEIVSSIPLPLVFAAVLAAAALPDAVALPTSGVDPVVVTPSRRPDQVEIYTNRCGVGPTRSVPSTQPLVVVTPGRGGYELPEQRAVGGVPALAKQPKPVRALPLRMKDAAICDLHILDVDEGMISSYVWSLLEDHEGNLWFGTNHGVSRYDGHRFTHYTTEEGLGHNRVRSMLQDRRGHIWFGTDGGGVCRYDGHRFTRYTQADGLNSDHVWAMLEDSRGRLWFGTAKGVTRYDGNSFLHYGMAQGLPFDNVWCMLEDSQGKIWFGTQGGGVASFDGAFTHYNTDAGLSSNFVWSMAEDDAGHLWFGTRAGGVNRFDGDTFTHYGTEQGLSSNDIWSVIKDRQGNLWFGTRGGGADRFDGQTITHYGSAEGLSSDRVWCLLEDGNGKIWLGTRGGGVNRYSGGSFAHLTTHQGLIDDNIWSLLQDRDNELWIGTGGSGVSRFDGVTLDHFTEEQGLADNIVSTMLQDRSGALWFGTTGGVSRYDGDKFINYGERQGLCHEDVQSSFEDSRGHLWFGTLSGGVSRFDGERFTTYDTSNGLCHNTVRAIIEDQAGHMWFGTQGGGVSRYDGDQFVHYSAEDGLGNNLIWSIIEDHQGHLWFATQGGGVARYDGQGFTQFTTADGLSHNWVWYIVEDRTHNLWLSTESGFTVMIPQAGTAPDDPEYRMYTFERGDGLRRMDFSQNACLDDQNRLWWGSADGLTMLDLKVFKLPHRTPEVRLQGIDIAQTYIDYRRVSEDAYRATIPFGEPLMASFDTVIPFRNYPATLCLPHKLNHLTFQFSGIDWDAPHKLSYRYYLEGQDEAWSAWTSDQTADYRNLAPGEYTLHITAMGAAGLESEPFTYAFEVVPAWWMTWWAKIVYILSVGLGIVGMVMSHTNRLKRRHKELEETVNVRTAEVVAQTTEAIWQRNRSEELLRNILPAQVAEELKQNGHIAPVQFEEVSILFADFKEFTNIVASIPGRKLVEELDEIFQRFDDIMEAVGLEKIQTVGDTYVSVAGLPSADAQHAVKCVQAAESMIAYLKDRNRSSAIKWRLRVGIHSGPITAGVVGKRKFTYDIFGDTVNIAARIESAGAVDRINVSAYTYDLIKDHYQCEYRGKINAKGKGHLDMYFVGSAASKTSVCTADAIKQMPIET